MEGDFDFVAGEESPIFREEEDFFGGAGDLLRPRLRAVRVGELDICGGLLLSRGNIAIEGGLLYTSG